MEPFTAVAADRLAERLTAVVKYLNAVANGRAAVADIHRLRLSVRRATAALKLFKRLLPRRRRRRLKKQFGRLRRAAGCVRDCDVLIRLVRDRLPGRGGRLWLRSLRTDRRRGVKALALAASTARPRRLARRADALVRQVRRRDRRPTRPEVSDLGGWARACLSPAIDGVSAALSDGRGSVKSLHRLRIRVKRLRYLLELVGESLPEEFRTRLYSAVIALQDQLGTLNDLVNARTHLRRLVRTAASKDAVAVRRLLTVIRADLNQAEQRFWGSCPQARVRTLRTDFERVLGESAVA